jgi:phospholipase A-2-activating protein
MEGSYVLSQSLAHHSGAARTVDCLGGKLLSGGIDKRVNLYRRSQDTRQYVYDCEFPFFKDYIMAVKIMDDEKFVVGCKDKNVYICGFEDKRDPLLIFQGHTGPVNSVDINGSIVVSGSWDATAKIWDLESGQCTKTLEGHAYAVTVFINSRGEIVTGSQDGVLHLWSAEGIKIKSVQAHSNIIRSIVEVPSVGMMTCSNDMKVKLWSLDLDELTQYEDHSSFVFTVGYIRQNSMDFVSGGEDFKMNLYLEGKKAQEIAHPNTVWSVCIDREFDNDIISACGDR